MRLILIDGGPASGKNTLGTLLKDKLKSNGEPSELLDLDTFVEEINPSWVWDDKQREKEDQSKARENIAKVVDSVLKSEGTCIVIGERLLTKEDVLTFLKRLRVICPVFLFHLSVPLKLRNKRLRARGSHSLID
jgi:thymidylate kinase